MPKLSKNDQRAKASAAEARRRKQVALARLREMEADEKAGKLVAAERVKDAWVKILSALKTAVLRMPDKLAPQLAAVSDAHETGAVLLAECEAVLQELHGEIECRNN
jgi:hypothetical protein